MGRDVGSGDRLWPHHSQSDEDEDGGREDCGAVGHRAMGWNIGLRGYRAGTWGDVVMGYDVESWCYGVRSHSFLHTHRRVLPSFVFNLLNFCISCSVLGTKVGAGHRASHPIPHNCPQSPIIRIPQHSSHDFLPHILPHNPTECPMTPYQAPLHHDLISPNPNPHNPTSHPTPP